MKKQCSEEEEVLGKFHFQVVDHVFHYSVVGAYHLLVGAYHHRVEAFRLVGAFHLVGLQIIEKKIIIYIKIKFINLTTDSKIKIVYKHKCDCKLQIT